MTESIQAMRERRSALAKDTRNMLDKNTHAEWNDELQAKYDENIAEIDRIDSAVEREQKLIDREAEAEFEARGGRIHDPENAQSEEVAIFNKWLRGGDRSLSAAEWQAVRNTMSTTTDSEGGYTVPTETAANILEALKAYGGMREVANIIQTADGAAMQWGTSDGTAEEGELVAQNTAAADADPDFGTVGLDVYKFSSKVVTVPIELLQDSAANLEGFIQSRLETRLGRITNKYFTTGTGTNQPRGIVTAASSGKVGATGQTGSVLYEDLVDLEHAVDPAYRQMGNCRWMMNDDSIKIVRKLKDDYGRPLWLPSYDAGVRGGQPQELAGYPITTNQNVATMAANAKSILFGDFKHYTIRDVMAFTLFRFTDSAYAKKGQVGFLAWMRSGGNFTDVGGAVKFYQNSAS